MTSEFHEDYLNVFNFFEGLKSFLLHFFIFHKDLYISISSVLFCVIPCPISDVIWSALLFLSHCLIFRQLGSVCSNLPLSWNVCFYFRSEKITVYFFFPTTSGVLLEDNTFQQTVPYLPLKYFAFTNPCVKHKCVWKSNVTKRSS